MRTLLATVVLAAGTLTPLAAPSVRLASEAEIITALHGCWDKEQRLGGISETRADGYNYTSVACFKSDNTIQTWAFSIHPKWGGDGVGGSGTYTISDDKLELRGELVDGWIFGHTALSCNVLMDVGKAFRLENCIGRGENQFEASEASRAVPNMSFVFSAEQSLGEWP